MVGRRDGGVEVEGGERGGSTLKEVLCWVDSSKRRVNHLTDNDGIVRLAERVEWSQEVKASSNRTNTSSSFISGASFDGIHDRILKVGCQKRPD